MNELMQMSRLQPGQQAVVQTLRADDAMLRRFLDIGLIPGTIIQCLGRSPGGDPAAYQIRGAVIAIRAASCAEIQVLPCGAEAEAWG